MLKCIRSGDITSKACQKVLTNAQKLAQLREECAKKKNRDKDVCKQLNTVPGLPTPSGSGPLDPITSGLPLRPMPRAAGGMTVDAWGARGPTMGDLMDVYDPALVSLLVPGMVTR